MIYTARRRSSRFAKITREVAFKGLGSMLFSCSVDCKRIQSRTLRSLRCWLPAQHNNALVPRSRAHEHIGPTPMLAVGYRGVSTSGLRTEASAGCSQRAWTFSCGAPVHCSQPRDNSSASCSYAGPSFSGRVPSSGRQRPRRGFVVHAEQQDQHQLRQQRNRRGTGRTARKQYDVLALSNICIDVIVPQDELPGPDPVARERLLQQLSASPPCESSWELGANCNFMVAAARLGMRAGAVGHVGTDVYGRFLNRLLQVTWVA